MGWNIVRKVLMRGCELGSETAGLVECPTRAIIGQEGIRCGSWFPCRACGATQKWADRGRAVGRGSLASLQAYMQCQPAAACSLPGHAKSDGTSQQAPKRLLSLFLTLPCYFGRSLLLFLPCAVRQLGSLPAGPTCATDPPPSFFQASCPHRTIGAWPQSACLAIPRVERPRAEKCLGC